MVVDDIEAAITQVGEILEREPPFYRHEKSAYANTAKAAFELVKKARADGFSFVQICAAFEKAGLLPRDAHPHSFRQAFYREGERQKKDKDLTQRILNSTEAEKQTPVLPARPEQKTPGRSPHGMKPPRVMHLPNRTAESGTGVEVRPDNTFNIRPVDPDDLPVL